MFAVSMWRPTSGRRLVKPNPRSMSSHPTTQSTVRLQAGRLALVAPGLVFAVVLVAIPLGILLVVSLLTDASYSIDPIPTVANYVGLVDDGVFGIVLWRTVVTAVTVTGACLLIGFPIALLLARATPRRRAIGPLVLMVPLWTNLLVKIYSWKAILASRRSQLRPAGSRADLGTRRPALVQHTGRGDRPRVRAAAVHGPTHPDDPRASAAVAARGRHGSRFKPTAGLLDRDGAARAARHPRGHDVCARDVDG